MLHLRGRAKDAIASSDITKVPFVAAALCIDLRISSVMRRAQDGVVEPPIRLFAQSFCHSYSSHHDIVLVRKDKIIHLDISHGAFYSIVKERISRSEVSSLALEEWD